MIRVNRVYRFSASHRLHSDQLSEQANQELYGKCNNPFGHGHDYALHVGIRGTVDGPSGRLVSPGRLDRYVGDKILRVFDHQDINADVPDFQGVSTTENLAVDVERRLQSDWKKEFGDAVELDRVFVRETPRNTFELRTSR